jgi:ribosome-associated protein
MLWVTVDLQIPLSEIEFSYARSSGPGGQNVNKVNSKVLLRWNLLHSPSVHPEMRARLLARLHAKLNSEGDLLVATDSFRDQIRNREAGLKKLRDLLAAAAVVPKARKKSRPSRSSVKRAKEKKRQHSQKKEMRRRDFRD